MEELKLRIAEPNDVYTLNEIRKQARFKIYKKIYNDLQISDFKDISNFYLSSLQDPRSKIICATINNKVIGFIHIYSTEDETRIKSLFVEPEYQSKGVGSQLLNEAKKFSKNKITLSVNSKNNNAINFYKKKSFEIVEGITHSLNIGIHTELLLEMSTSQN